MTEIESKIYSLVGVVEIYKTNNMRGVDLIDKVEQIVMDNEPNTKIKTIKQDIEQLLDVLPKEYILPNGYDLVRALKCIINEVELLTKNV